MEKKIKIAIIDSGFDFQSQLSSRIADYKNFCGESETDECGHGTSIVRTLDSICRDCDLYILKALGPGRSGDFRSVQAAIGYALDKKVDIINASFGVESGLYGQEIDRLCREAYRQGVILATTSANDQSQNYLYEHEKVLKVVGGKCIRENKLCYKDGIFFVKGMARMIPWLGGHYVLRGGNSFSLPLAIPYIIKAMQAGCMGLDDVSSFLEGLAEKADDAERFYSYPTVWKEEIRDMRIYGIVKWYIEEKGLAGHGGSIAGHVFEPYRIEEILHGLEHILECVLPCPEFQYPDWCYAANLSNKVSKIIHGDCGH